MKRQVLAAGILSLASSVSLAPLSRAAGLIVIDPITPAAVIRPGLIHPLPTTPVQPGHPLHPSTPFHPPGRPVLHGGVTFGLHMQSESVHVDITDQVAKTYITQTFVNDTDQNLAGTYLFPLPEDTTFSSFSLHIDGKPIEGKILEAAAARQQYEEIVRRMVDPGLLEYADYKTARARIFPIPAHGSKKVELEYTQLLKADNGLLKYSFPLKAEGDSLPVEELKVDVKLNSKQGLRTIWSPSHQISSNRPDNHQAKIAFSSPNTVPDKDFLLYYSVSDKEFAPNLLTNKAAGEDGYFLVTLTPPMKSSTVQAKDVVLVVDVSGSMEGEKIKQAREALNYVVNALNPQDHFSIVSFNTDVDSLDKHLLEATPENKNKAKAFIKELEARGGTNIGDALRTGATILKEKSDRPAYLVMCTDGEPTVGETSVSGLAKKISPDREIRLFDFGVGYDVNTRLLNKLSETNHGTTQYVQPSENLETALSSFYQKIKSPVLTNVSIAYNGIQTKDIYPGEVKDIFAGNQVMLLGRYKGSGKATLNVTGKLDGVQKAYSFPLNFEEADADHTYLPRLWAMRRIGHLTDVAQENHDNKEIVDEIVSLSKKYGIITQYTSFLVTDPSEDHRLASAGTIVPQQTMRREAMFAGTAPNVMPIAAPASKSAPKGMVRAHLSMMPSGGRGGSSDGVAFQVADDRPQIHDFRAAMASATASATGAANFNFNAQNAMLKNSVNVAGNNGDAKGRVKNVDDKAFYLVGDTWQEAGYKPGSAKVEKIAFGSKEYFDLIKSVPGISKYLAVGQQVSFVFKGKCYEIIKPSTT